MSASARITADVIDAAAILQEVGGAEAGAVLLFLGTVRQQNEGRSVSGMRYEAYVAMAEAELAAIVEEAATRCADARVFAVHRIGELRIGDISVAVAVSTPHRAEAYDVSRYVIEEIKKRLPVWKHEHYTDGAAQWLDGHSPAPAAQRHD